MEPLTGRHVVLEPLAMAHVEALTAAASGPRGTYATTFVPHGPQEVRKWVTAALAGFEAGTAVPFAVVRRADGRVVGSTRFGELERWIWPAGHPSARATREPDAVELGWTWLTEEAQRTAINTESKRLLLGYAFESWAVHRVTLITDVRNTRSRAAIERIGARLDGILRAHFPAADGTIRDTATYSIVASEWPEIRSRLDRRLAS